MGPRPFPKWWADRYAEMNPTMEQRIWDEKSIRALPIKNVTDKPTVNDEADAKLNTKASNPLASLTKPVELRMKTELSFAMIQYLS